MLAQRLGWLSARASSQGLTSIGTSSLLAKRTFKDFAAANAIVRVWRDSVPDTQNKDTPVPTGVTVVAFNRPMALNSLTEEVGREFGTALRAVHEDVAPTHSEETGKQTRAVVLTGMGSAFSAGGDWTFLTARSEDNPHHNALAMKQFYRLFLEPLRSLPVPVIAAINGHAIGAGLCVALATDMRVASLKAKMGVTFVGIGIHPGMGATHFLPALVGNQIAARLLLTADLVDGAEAKQLGLVLDAVEPDQVLPQALALGRRIANQSNVAVQTCVRTLRSKQDQGLESALWREADAQAQCYATRDIREGIASFKEKRPPVYRK